MAGRTREPVTRAVAFWDASALLPLCVRQGQSVAASRLFRTYDIAVWWATPVELAEALASLSRMRKTTVKQLSAARILAANLAELWWVVQPSNIIRLHATTIVERYDLRPPAALQLAAALEWCEHESEGRVFLTADSRLREIAMYSGFEVELVS